MSQSLAGQGQDGRGDRGVFITDFYSVSEELNKVA